ncbi:MAG: CPBP family intramembrane metalloprotease [Candidatus Thermoplasmatota archaeon]|nr:CPBP family intramembrane metalloprotease [Candidatus Thermoplasmatota archaeon]
MDFNQKNPTHLIAVFLVFLSLLMFVAVPIFTYFGSFGDMTSTTSQIGEFPDGFKFVFEIFALLMQLTLVIILFILVPFAWYKIVNKFSLDQMKEAIRLKKDQIDMTVIYGIITAAIMLGIVMVIGALLSVLGFNLENASNIQDIEQIFSIPAMLVLIVFQPIAEEIFYRGFLLEKLEKISSAPVAIVITAVLFGLAHLSTGNIYPALLTGIAGAILAILVIKTQNLTTAIIAHILFNVASFSIYILGQSFI